MQNTVAELLTTLPGGGPAPSPDRCLFIDDTAVNVSAAREFGMTALRYCRIEDLRHALAPLRTTR